MTELRIHHFFDIIRDYGAGTDLDEHTYGHSYHLVGKGLYENVFTRVKLVIRSDDICVNCKKLSLESWTNC